jgi:hypothetical protein
MTTGRPEADSSREDELVSRLYQQVTEQQAARFAAGYDMAVGLARYRAWLGEYIARQQAGPQEIPAAVPAQLPPAPPGAPARLRGRVPSPRRRWGSWLAPVAAAVAVVAVAIALVVVREMPGARPAPVASPGLPATGIPQYYLTFDQPLGDETKPVGLLLGATLSGKTLVTLQPPRSLSFVGITGAADDRTFVADADRAPWAATGSQAQSRTWYLLRVTGASTRVRLAMTRLPVPTTPAGTCIEGIALSPDGTKLAVATEPCRTNPVRKVTEVLRVYSVATGKVLRSWSSGQSPVIRNGGGGDGDAKATLAWVGNHALAYQGSVQTGPHEYTSGLMELELSHPDGYILASSRLAIPLAHVSIPGPPTAPARPPFGCGLIGAPIVISGDGKSFVCGGSGASTAKLPDASTAKLPRLWCPADKSAWNTVAFAGYSLTTGKPTGYLSGYRTGCPIVYGVPLWANNTGSLVIGYIGRGIVTPQFGVFSHGTFRPLPIPMLMPGNTWWQGGFLMNRVAW